MYIKRLLSFLLPLFLVSLTSQVVLAATVANTFQITTDGSQQTSPFIDNNLVVYTSNSDIWGYDLGTATNFPILERDGQQFTTHLFRNLVIYEDTPTGESTPDVRMYNVKNGRDMLIAGGFGAQAGGVTNGKYVVYIDGGACGSIHAYNIKDETDTVIRATGCQPLRISDDIVVWPNGAPGGTNIYGYDLKNQTPMDVVVEDNFQESPNIFHDKVVWLHYITGALGDYNAIKMKDLSTGEERTIYESTTTSLQWPAVSNKYIVWSESPAQNVNSVKAANIDTGEVFEVQAPGSHQNSHTMPSIWNNIATWMSFRTGNGDIYGSEFTKL